MTIKPKTKEREHVMKQLHRYGSAAIGTGIVLAALITPAPAMAAWSDCSLSYMCLWGNDSWKNDPWFERKALGPYNTGYFNNDESSSAANRSSIASFMLFDNTNQDSSAGAACLPRNYSSKNLHNEGFGDWGDRISSMKIISGACPDGVDYLGLHKTS